MKKIMLFFIILGWALFFFVIVVGGIAYTELDKKITDCRISLNNHVREQGQSWVEESINGWKYWTISLPGGQVYITWSGYDLQVYPVTGGGE